MGLKYLANIAAQNVAEKSNHGFPAGWVIFGGIMLGLLYVGVRWARKRNSRG